MGHLDVVVWIWVPAIWGLTGRKRGNCRVDFIFPQQGVGGSSEMPGFFAALRMTNVMRNDNVIQIQNEDPDSE
jgi:hypothetical protein